MALCKKGYTLETKVCGINCAECEHYDTRNKKERLKDEAKEKAIKLQEQVKRDLTEFVPPEDCYRCKYLLDEGGGFACHCQARQVLGKSKSEINCTTNIDIMPTYCPFWKNKIARLEK